MSSSRCIRCAAAVVIVRVEIGEVGGVLRVVGRVSSMGVPVASEGVGVVVLKVGVACNGGRGGARRLGVMPRGHASRRVWSTLREHGAAQGTIIGHHIHMNHG